MKQLPLILLAMALPLPVTTGSAMAAKSAALTFRSFDGGGPEYRAVLNSGIVSCRQEKRYDKPNHGELDGAGFTITFTLTGLKPGETALKVEERSPLGENTDWIYAVKVDRGLNVEIKKLTGESPDKAVKPMPTLAVKINGNVFYASPEPNASARAFIEKLRSGPITVTMRDYGGFEKVGPLPWSLERSDEQITTEPGDIILYQGNQITIYYDKNTWNFTRLAKIGGAGREKLLEAFGRGKVSAEFWVEWSE